MTMPCVSDLASIHRLVIETMLTLESVHREYNLILNLHCEHDSHSLYANP